MSQSLHFQFINQRLMLMALHIFSYFKLVIIILRCCLTIENKLIYNLRLQEEEITRIFCTSIRRGYLLLLNHTSTAAN